MITAGVLISGSGTNLQAILDRVADGTPRLSRRRRDLEPRRRRRPRARPRGRRARRASSTTAPSRPARRTTPPLVDALRAAGVELVVLAGFDRLVTRVLLGRVPGTRHEHPSRAAAGVQGPARAAPGARVRRADRRRHRALRRRGRRITARSSCRARSSWRPDDTEETLARRILEVEHTIYPAAIQLFAEGRLVVEGPPRPHPGRARRRDAATCFPTLVSDENPVESLGFRWYRTRASRWQ